MTKRPTKTAIADRAIQILRSADSLDPRAAPRLSPPISDDEPIQFMPSVGRIVGEGERLAAIAQAEHDLATE